MPVPSIACAAIFFVVSCLPTAVGAQPPLAPERGGWTPTHALAARALGLRDLDAAAADAAVARLAAESPRLRVDVLRAGLRLADRAAAHACAVHLDWRELDAWEHRRVVELCVDGFTRPGTRVDFERLRSIVGSVDMDRILRTFPGPPYALDATQYLAQLHRQLLAEHVPALCALGRARPALLEDVFSNLGVVLPRTDRHRPEVAALVLERSDIPPAGTGLHPLLAACLDRFWGRDGSGEPDGWEIRWLMQSTPVAADAPRLAACLRRLPTSAEYGRIAVVRAMRHLRDDATDALLRAVERDGTDTLEGTVATAALAARGDVDARGRLHRLAAADDWAFGLWLEVAPTDAVAALRDWLLGPDDTRVEWAIEAVVRLDGDVRSYLHLDLSADAFDGLADTLVASDVDGARLARIGALVPRCNARTLARAACARLPASRTLAALEDDRGTLAFLEAAAPDALRRAMRTIVDRVPAARRLALDALLAIGDPASGPRLIEYVTGLDASDDDGPGSFVEHLASVRLLARSPCPAVEAHVAGALAACKPDDAEARRDAIVALAELRGVAPETVDFLLREHDDVHDAAAHRAMCDAVAADLRAGDGPGAIARLLAAMPDRLGGPLWRVDTPAVRAHLTRLQARRELKLYAFATAQLAALGDPAARAEAETAMRAGRYRWMDSVLGPDEALSTFGYDFARTIPFWLDQLESNCCRRVLATCVFEGAFGLEPEVGEGVCETPATRMRRWWAEHRDGTFVASRIFRGGFIPVRD